MNKNDFAIVIGLCEIGLTPKQIIDLAALLINDRIYSTVELSETNTTAIGFIYDAYYETHDYEPNYIAKHIKPMLDDWGLIPDDGIYTMPDGALVSISLV